MAAPRNKCKTIVTRRGGCRGESLHRMQGWRRVRELRKLHEFDRVRIASSAHCHTQYPKLRRTLPYTLSSSLTEYPETFLAIYEYYAPLTLSYPTNPRVLGGRAGNIRVKWSGESSTRAG